MTVSGCLHGGREPAAGGRLLFDQARSRRFEVAALTTRHRGIGALPDAIGAAHRGDGARQMLVYDG